MYPNTRKSCMKLVTDLVLTTVTSIHKAYTCYNYKYNILYYNFIYIPLHFTQHNHTCTLGEGEPVVSVHGDSSHYDNAIKCFSLSHGIAFDRQFLLVSNKQ